MIEINELTDRINALERTILGNISDLEEQTQMSVTFGLSKQECILGYSDIFEGLNAYKQVLLDFQESYK